MQAWLKYVLSLIIALSAVSEVSASHFYGADFFYTYVSGTTYTVTLVAYGDCGGSSFPSFPGSSPEVKVFRGDTLKQTVSLTIQSPTSGVEVTPVCPSQLGNTNCVNVSKPIPGVKKFVYATNITLGDTSSKWKFQFDGTMGFSSSAGRSASITNLSTGSAGVSTMMLEATLNNTLVTNSSPVYTTIPTPFFCINRAANYNPGTVDPDVDSLVYALVPGLEAPSSTVTYATGYSATAPLAVSTGSLSFSTSTGQLSFVPNLVQRSLVVYRVSEYRGGVLVGTSMREMTFVVISTCTNNAPIGKVSGVTGGTKKDSVTVNVCQAAGALTFSINPTDADGDVINMVASGIPSGASFNITANNTTAPLGAFSWNVSTVTPGAYTFFVTYTDNGCPLSSKQTQAYTINVLADPTISFALVSPATCIKKAVFTVTSSVSGPWKIKFYQGSSAVDSISTSSTATTVTDSLVPGTYTMRTFNSNNCFKDTLVTLVSPSTTILAATVQRPTCNKFSNGAINITASNSVTPYTYAINTNAYSGNSSFTGLPSGSYIIHVKDSNLCIKDTTIVLSDSLKVSTSFALTNVLCNSSNTGVITVTGTGGAGSPYSYSLNSATAVSANSFNNLLAGTYRIRTMDALGCYIDSTVTLTQPTSLGLMHSITDVTCAGAADGTIIEVALGGVSPYTYNMNGGSYTASGTFTALTAGNYNMSVKDKNGCIKTATVTVSEPAAMKINSFTSINPKCHGDADGSFALSVSGGTTPYMYGVNSGALGSSSTISGLPAGAYLIHIVDANGCKKDTTSSLFQPTAIQPYFTLTQPKCATLANGIIKITTTGGIKPYTYSVDSSAYTVKVGYTSLAAGAHLVSIKDSNGCVVDSVITLKDSLVITSSTSIQDASCFGSSDGGFIVTPAGGVNPYKIAIDKANYRDTFMYTGFAAQQYTLHVKDSFGCIQDTVIEVGEPDKLLLNPQITFNNCYGLDTVGKVELHVTGGTEPYAYQWSNDSAAVRSGITGLGNGIYKVRVTDAHSCKDSLTAEVTYDDCCTPFIPSAFSPNGDGKNDDFKVLAKGDMKLILFSVYNRFGERVFTTNEFGKGWDGKWKGSPQDMGTYFWYLKAICGNSGEHTVELKGDVTLIK